MPRPSGLLPLWLKHRMKRALLGSGAVRFGLLAKSYVPSARRAATGAYALNSADLQSPPHDSGLPLPPQHLRMDYAEDDAEYLASGERVANALRQLLAAHGRSLGPEDCVLDWGCSSGRVLRHFHRESLQMPVWGSDIAEDYILWNKANLAPPFRFFTGSELPHIPFEDRTFSFIYGISVFTHLEFLADRWLLELRRVMRPGGMAIFTIHDEASIAHMRGMVLSQGMTGRLDLAEAARHEQYILTGESWADTFPFYSSEFIRKEWGAYFDVLDIRGAYTDHGQTAVVLRKPSS